MAKLARLGLCGVFLCIIAIFPFSSGLKGDFIQDDIALIQDNAQIHQVANIPSLFVQTYWHDKAQADLYRPLSISSYAIDGMFWGRDASGAPLAGGVHASNLLLHALTVVCIWVLFRRLIQGRAASFLGTVIFAVHPVHTEAVVHLVGRADLLMTLFFLLSMLLYVENEREQKSRTVLSAAFYLFSMFSKEMGIMLLPVIGVYDYLWRERTTLSNFVRLEAKRLWPFAFAFLVFMLMRGFVIGASQVPPRFFAFSGESQFMAFINPSPGEVLFTMIHAIGCYILSSFIPLWHSADYSGFPHSAGLSLQIFMSFVALAILLAGALLRYRHGDKQLIFWLLWFFLTILPVSNLIFISGVIFAERVLYLPSVAACAVFGIIGQSLWSKSKALAVMVFCALVALFGFLSHGRSAQWKDSLTIFEYSQRESPFFGFIGKASLVGEYIKQLDKRPELLPKALDLARAAVAQATTRVNVAQLAGLLERHGDFEESSKWWSGLWLAVPENEYYYKRSNEVLKKYLFVLEESGNSAKAIRAVEFGTEYARKKGNEEELSFWLAKADELFEKELAELISQERKEEVKKTCDRLNILNPSSKISALRCNSV